MSGGSEGDGVWVGEGRVKLRMTSRSLIEQLGEKLALRGLK